MQFGSVTWWGINRDANMTAELSLQNLNTKISWNSFAIMREHFISDVSWWIGNLYLSWDHGPGCSAINIGLSVSSQKQLEMLNVTCFFVLTFLLCYSLNILQLLNVKTIKLNILPTIPNLSLRVAWPAELFQYLLFYFRLLHFAFHNWIF